MTEAGDGTTGDGTVRMYVSDERNAIGQFEHLNVTITEVRLRPAGEATADGNVSGEANVTGELDANASATNATVTNATAANATANATVNASADADGEWRTYAVEERTVDLTELQGENATRLGNLTVPTGQYEGVAVRISDIEATLKTGERVTVKLPSDRLRVRHEFTVGATATDFVFDITVFEAGKSGKYVLKPVAGESGTDQPIRLVNDGTTRGGNASVGAGANASVGTNANATVGTNASTGVSVNATGETASTVGNTTAGGGVNATVGARANG